MTERYRICAHLLEVDDPKGDYVTYEDHVLEVERLKLENKELRKLHAALSMRKAPPLPHPCLLISSGEGMFAVIGVHGDVVTSAGIEELETFKTGLGYPAYIKREIQFDAVSVTTYEEQQ